ncbi:hypothetical protein Leryth_025951 [Lithospermum erythrorhizon]|nr:hypothetical protein Leryth_025951 [Lithospermum erythrorhizon]
MEKRKRSDNQEINIKTEIKREDENKVTLDEEVEEFYAILKRVRVAVKYFKNGDGKKEKKSGNIIVPDLNVDPVVEQMDSASSGMPKC